MYSNSGIPSDEDDEPLFEISKVETLNTDDKKSSDVECSPTIQSTKVRKPRIRPKAPYVKLCYVPLCPNSTRSTPDKMFITVPVNPDRRKLWLETVGKSSAGRNPKSPMFCCQDHFNLERDMRNYEDYLTQGKVQMQLEATAVPHIFLCNKYGNLPKDKRIAVLRRLHHNKNSQNFHKLEEDITVSKLTVRQRLLREANKRKSEKISSQQVKKPIFIEVPTFEFIDDIQSEIVDEEPDDTIVIEDSD